ncbi:hypothetical protein WICMUC_002377 [Wickerhamomyces mucosus]|uniref:Major facilitator superfamily (MFS) profile domain-containing protein n=1 Tax=Wickerhamomyces mucosus TaxID=1378264 RepID=A0A9P8PR66_9ASCO|nr:hypothetical protein WICMUC_002377 [Wickerhamomyces mucosus]
MTERFLQEIDPSKTAVGEHLTDNNHVSNRYDIISEDNISRIQSIHSSQQRNKSEKFKVPNDEERQIELEAVSSNDTIGNDAQDTKEAMFSEDVGVEFPEGGLKAYSALLGCFFGLTATFGLTNIAGVIQTYVSENQLQDVESSSVSWIFSVNLFVVFSMCIFSGTYFDRNGARLLLIVGSLLLSGGLVATGNATEYWHFMLSFGIVTAVGTGFTASPLVGVISHYFNRRRGFMNSIATTGGSVGGIIFPIMLRKLYAEVGFPWAMRIFAFIEFACLMIAVVLSRDRLSHKEPGETRSEKILTYVFSLDFKGLRDVRFLFCCLGCVFAECSALAVSTYYASYARAHGASLTTAYLLISLSHVGGIPGRWITGYYSDKIGRFNVMIGTTLANAIITWVILLPFANHHNVVLYVFTVTQGFVTGSVFSLLAVCCGQISKTEEYGRRFGTMYALVAVASLVWVPICGAIIGDGSLERYQHYVIFVGFTALASAICYYVSKSLCVGSNPFSKF